METYQYYPDCGESQGIISDAFAITDDQTADWALGKIKAAREDTARWQAYYDGQMDKIKAANERTETYFSALLERYFATVPHKASKTQESYQLPGGKLVRKEQRPSYDRDEDALLEWAKVSCPTAVKIKESIAWDDVKKRLSFQPSGEAVDAETGEYVPGVKAVVREPVFQISFAKEESGHA